MGRSSRKSRLSRRNRAHSLPRRARWSHYSSGRHAEAALARREDACPTDTADGALPNRLPKGETPTRRADDEGGESSRWACATSWRIPLVFNREAFAETGQPCLWGGWSGCHMPRDADETTPPATLSHMSGDFTSSIDEHTTRSVSRCARERLSFHEKATFPAKTSTSPHPETPAKLHVKWGGHGAGTSLFRWQTFPASRSTAGSPT